MTECVSYISNLKVLSHEEVEGGTGMGSDGANATATIPQETQAQVSTLLCLLLKQQLWKLNTHIKTFTLRQKRSHFIIKGTTFKVKRVNHQTKLHRLAEANLVVTKNLIFDLISLLTFDTRALCVAKQCCKYRAL